LLEIHIDNGGATESIYASYVQDRFLESRSGEGMVPFSEVFLSPYRKIPG
jgi:hypothetical protein